MQLRTEAANESLRDEKSVRRQTISQRHGQGAGNAETRDQECRTIDRVVGFDESLNCKMGMSALISPFELGSHFRREEKAVGLADCFNKYAKVVLIVYPSSRKHLIL